MVAARSIGDQGQVILDVSVPKTQAALHGGHRGYGPCRGHRRWDGQLMAIIALASASGAPGTTTAAIALSMPGTVLSS